jgi:hypothetical protein
MGNSLRPTGTIMNPIDRDTIFGREMIKILSNIKEPKLGKPLPSATDDNGKEIEGQYFKYRAQACCIDAILDKEPSGINQTQQAIGKKMLYIPIPDIAKKDNGKQTSCNDIGENCLETGELGVNFTKDYAKCGNDLNMNGSIICDSFIKDVRAKQLYDQNCIVDTGRINEDNGDQVL